MNQDEKVLVVPRTSLLGPSSPGIQGFVAGNGEPYLSRVEAHGTFTSRGTAEKDPTTKQIIPYGVVLYGASVFVMRRGAGGGEARLHHKLSIGVGGHVNPEDGSAGDSLLAEGRLDGGFGLAAEAESARGTLTRSLRREIDEELATETTYTLAIAGVLNDDSNSVGQVHFGIVYLVRPRTPAIRVREEELAAGEFVSIPSLRDRIEDMETWSSIVAKALLESDAARLG